MKKFSVPILALLIISCGQNNIITQPEPCPETEIMVQEVAVGGEFQPIEIEGDIYWGSNFLDYTEDVNGVRKLIKGYIAVEHYVEGLEVVGIVVHFRNKPVMRLPHEELIDDGNFMRDFIVFKGEPITEGSRVKIKLLEVLRLGVYEGILL